MEKKIILIWIIVFASIISYGKASKTGKAKSLFLMDCLAPSKLIDLRVNNLRARLTNDNPFIGENSGIIFPSSGIGVSVTVAYGSGIWIGGVDQIGNLKLSAGFLKSNGYDFFSGPLDPMGLTDLENCNNWNNIFAVKASSIEKHLVLIKKFISSGQPIESVDIPVEVKYWPAKGNPFFKDSFGWELPVQQLASFWDMDNNGEYNPTKGDYPYIATKGSTIGYHEGKLIPSQISFHVVNDSGGSQTLTGIGGLRMEMQVHSFAYSTRDELNDMSFFDFKLLNKSAKDYYSFYSALWIDPDIGCYADDYIGCLPSHNLAFAYNQDNIDGFDSTNLCGGTTVYKDSIPIFGIGMLESPLVGKLYKRDINGNILYDQNGNKILVDIKCCNPNITQDTLIRSGFTSFIYNENGSVGNLNPITHDPQIGRDYQFYNVLRGLWRDGTPLTNGGSGLNLGSTDTVKYAFPGEPNDPNNWSMCSSSYDPGDRRIIMGTGPLVFKSGMQDHFTYYFAPTFDVRMPCPDISKLKFNDSLVKSLFNAGFEANLIGPDAPDITTDVDDQAINFSLSNGLYSNNANESFSNNIIGLPAGSDNTYKFEGYKVYQLRNNMVRYDQLNDPSQAVLISQSDINNSISDISNWRFGKNPDSLSNKAIIWKPIKQVDGSNQGLVKEFSTSTDYFAPAGTKLQNGKKYYYAAVAYAYNNWKNFDFLTANGQSRPYLEGLRNYKIYTVIPQKASSTSNIDNSMVLIYNNPTSVFGASSLVFSGLEMGDQFDIYNVFGQKLISRTYVDGDHFINSSTERIVSNYDLSSINISKGIYFVRFRNSKKPSLSWLVQ